MQPRPLTIARASSGAGPVFHPYQLQTNKQGIGVAGGRTHPTQRSGLSDSWFALELGPRPSASLLFLASPDITQPDTGPSDEPSATPGAQRHQPCLFTRACQANGHTRRVGKPVQHGYHIESRVRAPGACGLAKISNRNKPLVRWRVANAWPTPSSVSSPLCERLTAKVTHPYPDSFQSPLPPPQLIILTVPLSLTLSWLPLAPSPPLTPLPACCLPPPPPTPSLPASPAWRPSS